jgi:hypothetical protein
MPNKPLKPKIDLHRGVIEPVVLLISRRQVQESDIASVLLELKPVTGTRENCWRYRGQMTLVVTGYDDDPRELVDIPEVRAFLAQFSVAWPYWSFFFNQVDDSIILLGSCYCGIAFSGKGEIKIDVHRLAMFLRFGFDAMNAIFEQYQFPKPELEAMSRGVLELVERAGKA